MKKFYIQFSTDFHLLASLASIEDLSENRVVLVGPGTKMASLVAAKISAEHIVVDPRSPKLSFSEILPLVARSRVARDYVIISPFVFPLYVFLFLLKEGRVPGSIIRTDEGVGSYATTSHYYASLRVENPRRSAWHCAIKAFTKKTAMRMTKLLGVCREQYIFKKDLTVDQERVNRLSRNIDLLGRLDGLNGKIVYISQPGVSRTFGSPDKYAGFIRKMTEKAGRGEVLVKRHPADDFDYTEHGFEVVDGFPMELYHIENSAIIGFSSTALLMARIVGGCDHVYYMKTKGTGPFYDGLSTMNKRLFDFYLKPLDYNS